jgi:hypothetical protein
MEGRKLWKFAIEGGKGRQGGKCVCVCVCFEELKQIVCLNN